MNGKEHYREAERLLEIAVSHVSDDGSIVYVDGAEQILAAADVHAKLAEAAAKREPLVVHLGDANIDESGLDTVVQLIQEAMDRAWDE